MPPPRSTSPAHAATQRARRREAIVALLEGGPVANQDALRKALAKRGHRATQATLSRDLRDLGVVKAPDGYRLAADAGAGEATPEVELRRALHTWLTEAVAAQNLCLLHTGPGGAAPLGVALDAVQRAEILGTIAGDDTVLVVCPDARAAKRLAREFAQAGQSKEAR